MLSVALYWAAWFVQWSLFCHVLAVIDTSIPRLSAWLIWSDGLRPLRVRIRNSINHTSKKLAAKGVKVCSRNRSVEEVRHLRLNTLNHLLNHHLHFRETNKQRIVFSQSSRPRWWRGKRGVENKGRKPDSVSTATLIDILQVEQLSSGLTTAS